MQSDGQEFRILIVEDDYFLAADLVLALRAKGLEIAGSARDIAAASALLNAGRVDAAVVDLNLGSGPDFAIAEMLRERGVPFVFATGYDVALDDPRFADVPVVRKPINEMRLRDALAAVIERSAGPFQRGAESHRTSE